MSRQQWGLDKLLQSSFLPLNTRGDQIKPQSCFASSVCFWTVTASEGTRERREREQGTEIHLPRCPHPGNFITFRAVTGGVTKGMFNKVVWIKGKLLARTAKGCWKDLHSSLALGHHKRLHDLRDSQLGLWVTLRRKGAEVVSCLGA